MTFSTTRTPVVRYATQSDCLGYAATTAGHFRLEADEGRRGSYSLYRLDRDGPCRRNKFGYCGCDERGGAFTYDPPPPGVLLAHAVTDMRRTLGRARANRDAADNPIIMSFEAGCVSGLESALILLGENPDSEER